MCLSVCLSVCARSSVLLCIYMYIQTHIGGSSRVESGARAAGSGVGSEVPAAEARSTGGEKEEAHEVLCPRCGQMIDSRFAPFFLLFFFVPAKKTKLCFP